EAVGATEGEQAFIIDPEATFLENALGRYSKEINANDFCNMWSGALVQFGRVRRGPTEPPIVLRQPRLSGIFAMQPHKLEKIALKVEAFEQGLLGRILWVDARLESLSWAERRAQPK